jgi:hypothetical protein
LVLLYPETEFVAGPEVVLGLWTVVMSCFHETFKSHDKVLFDVEKVSSEVVDG